MRVVLDTNVLIAAFATRGICEDVFRIVLTEHELVLSDFILEEVERVLVDKLGMAPVRAKEVTRFLRDAAEIVQPAEAAPWPEKDPDDQWVVATAIVAEAQLLVSGDRHLLSASEGIPVEIISPRGFWERLKPNQGSSA